MSEMPCSAHFRDAVPRLELVTLFRDFLGIFRKVCKSAKLMISLYFAYHV